MNSLHCNVSKYYSVYCSVLCYDVLIFSKSLFHGVQAESARVRLEEEAAQFREDLKLEELEELAQEAQTDPAEAAGNDPQGRASKFCRARFRLYRSRFLQLNTK